MLPAAGIGGGEGRAGEGAGAGLSNGVGGVAAGGAGNGATGGSEEEEIGTGVAAEAGAGVEDRAGAGTGVESEAGVGSGVEDGTEPAGDVEGRFGLGIGVAEDGGDGGVLGAIGVILESGTGGAEGVASFDVSGLTGFRDGGGLGSFVFGSSGFPEFAVGSCMKVGKLSPEGAAPVDDLPGAVDVEEAPLPELAGTGAIADGSAGAGLLCGFCGVDGDAVPLMGTIVAGARGFVGASFFTSGDKGGTERAGFPLSAGVGEAVFRFFSVDPGEAVSHSPAPSTFDKVGVGSTGEGAVAIWGVVRIFFPTEDKVLSEGVGATPVEESDGLIAGLGLRPDALIVASEATEAGFDLPARSLSELLSSAGEAGGGVLPRGGSDVIRFGIFVVLVCRDSLGY